MTRKQLGYTRYALEKLLAEVILTLNGLANFDAAIAASIERINNHARDYQKPVTNPPQLPPPAE